MSMSKDPEVDLVSDSDSESESGFGATSVLLGYAGKNVPHVRLTAADSFIGGRPVWLGGSAPKPGLLECPICGSELDLLAQLNCPLEGKLYDRALYIFACHVPGCRREPGSVRCLRGIHKNAAVEERIRAELARGVDENIQPPKEAFGDQLFGGSSRSSNPFESGAFEAAAPLATRAPQPSSSKFKTKKRFNLELENESGRYPCKLLDIEEEYLTPEPTSATPHIQTDALDTEPTAANDTGSGDAGESGGAEVDSALASVAASVNDPVFTRFVKLVDNNPEQVLRYERGLKPIPFRKDEMYPLIVDPSQIPGRKVPEVQLMPHLISELETAEMIAEGMEWGSVVIATDEEDSLPPLNDNGVGYAEEWTGVQWEEVDISAQ